MKKLARSRIAALLVLLSLTFAMTQCGYILYPERKGQSGGQIDVEVLVMDCLWLIVGVVPGVVALVVDFTTGCIYEGGATVKMEPGSEMAFRLNDAAPMDAEVSMTIESNDRVVSVLVDKDVSEGQVLGQVNVQIPEDMESGYYDLNLKVDGETSVSWNLVVAD